MSEFLRSTKGKVIIIVSAAVVVIAAILLIFLLPGGETGYRSISVSKVSGTVMAENNGNEYAAYENMRLADGYALTTGKGSYTRLTLDGDKYMKLEEESRALFTNVGSANSHITAISLESGAMTAELVNPLTEEESFVVNTPNAVLAVRGTFFRAEVGYDETGAPLTNVYVYGGAVSCASIMPDGTVSGKEVLINQGCKLTADGIEPISMAEISDSDMVDIYNASYHGHAMFKETDELWQEILDRGIDLSDYYSPYDSGNVPAYTDGNITVTEGAESTSDAADPTDTAETTETEETTTVSSDQSETGTTAETAAPSPDPTTTPPSGGAADDNTPAVGSEVTDVTENNVSDTSESITSAESRTTTVTTTVTTAATTVPAVTSTPANTTPNIPAPEVTTTPKVTPPPEHTTSHEHTAPPEITTEPDHVHIWGEYVSNNDATCTEDGTKTAKCAECGEEDTVVVEGSALGHEFGDYVSNEDATCTEDGTKTAKCVRCDEEDTVDDEDSALGHEFGDYVITKDATCTEDEEQTRKCIRCDEEDIVVVEDSALGHDEVEEIVEPTMTEEGLRTVTCSRCEEVLSEEKLDKLDPIYLDLCAKLWAEFGSAYGGIIITETGFSIVDGQEIPYTGDYVIAQGETDLAIDGFYLTVISGTHNITLDGLNIENDKNHYHTGQGIISVYAGASAALTCTEKENVIKDKNSSIAINNEGELIIDGGTIKFDGFNILDTGLSNEGTFVLNDGALSFDCNYGDAIIRNSSTFEINGGSITFNSDSYISHGISNNGSFDISGGSVTLNGAFVGISNFGSFTVSGGSVVAFGENYGVENEGDFEISGGSVEISGGEMGIHSSYKPLVVDGGSLRLTDELMGVKIVNSNGDELTCVVYDSYPKDPFTLLDGSKYAYNLSREDAASDGKYYVWLPVELMFISVDEENFPDETFRSYVTDIVDRNGDGLLSNEEIEKVTSIYIYQTGGENPEELAYPITTFKGIEYFTKLQRMICYDCTTLTSLDVSRNTALTYLLCNNTGITELDVSKNTALEELDCSNTGITELDVSKNTALTDLDCSNTGITELDVSKNIALTDLTCSSTSITSLDISNNTALETLYIINTKITSIDLSQNTALKKLYLNNTKMTSIDLSHNTALDSLSCVNSEISSLDLSHNTALTDLRCTGSKITFLDVSNNTALDLLYCGSTGITALNLSNNTALRSLQCSNTAITSLDLSNNTALDTLYCYKTGITSLDLRNNTALYLLECYNTEITELDVSKNTELRYLQCYDTGITYLDLSNNHKLSTLSSENCRLAYVDVSQNTSLSIFKVSNNKYPIPADAVSFDTKNIPGFDPSKVTDVTNAVLENGIFTNITGDITYTYDCGNGHSETFTLVRG